MTGELEFVLEENLKGVQGGVLELKVADENVVVGESALSNSLLFLINDLVDEIVDLESLLRILVEQITLEKKLNEIVEDLNDDNDGLIGKKFVRRKLGLFFWQDFAEVQFEAVENFCHVFEFEFSAEFCHYKN